MTYGPKEYENLLKSSSNANKHAHWSFILFCASVVGVIAAGFSKDIDGGLISLGGALASGAYFFINTIESSRLSLIIAMKYE